MALYLVAEKLHTIITCWNLSLNVFFYNIGHHLEDVPHQDVDQGQGHQLDAGDIVDQVQVHHINLSFIYIYICGYVLYIYWYGGL